MRLDISSTREWKQVAVGCCCGWCAGREKTDGWARESVGETAGQGAFYTFAQHRIDHPLSAAIWPALDSHHHVPLWLLIFFWQLLGAGLGLSV